MDEYRHAIERMEPRHYLSASYYERTLTSLATLCVEKGLVHARGARAARRRRLPARARERAGRTNAPARERFRPGDRVRVKADHVAGHVRLPAYIRGKAGVVVAESPPYPFPDAHAHGVAAEDEPTYDVRFDSAELWPSAADAAFVHVGVFQSYLERVPEA